MGKLSFERPRPLVLLAFALACASGGGAPPDVSAGASPTDDQVTVQITNDIMPGRTVVVFILPEDGSRRRLGSVSPNGQESFRYRHVGRNVEYRLRAEVDGGGSETSIRFNLVGVTNVQWKLSDPNVRLVR